MRQFKRLCYIPLRFAVFKSFLKLDIRGKQDHRDIPRVLCRRIDGIDFERGDLFGGQLEIAPRQVDIQLGWGAKGPADLQFEGQPTVRFIDDYQSRAKCRSEIAVVVIRI